MDSVYEWFLSLTHFQIIVIVGAAFGLWWIFSRGQSRLFAGGLFCIAIVGAIATFPPEGDITLFRMVFMLGIGFWGWVLLSSANAYQELEIEQLDHDLTYEQKQNQLHIEKKRGQYIEPEAKKRVHILHQTLETESQTEELKQKTIDTSRKTLNVRDLFLAEGAKSGMTPDDLAAVNKERAMSHIKTNEELERAGGALKIADIIKTGDVQVVNKLTDELIKALRERQKMIDGDDTPTVKAEAIAAYDKTIAYLKGEIDGKQNPGGLALPGGRSKAKRPKKRNTNSGADYPSGVDADDI